MNDVILIASSNWSPTATWKPGETHKWLQQETAVHCTVLWVLIFVCNIFHDKNVDLLNQTKPLPRYPLRISGFREPTRCYSMTRDQGAVVKHATFSGGSKNESSVPLSWRTYLRNLHSSSTWTQEQNSEITHSLSLSYSTRNMATIQNLSIAINRLFTSSLTDTAHLHAVS